MLSLEEMLDSDSALPVRRMKLFLCDLFLADSRGRPAESGLGASSSNSCIALPLALKQLNTMVAERSFGL